MSALIKEYEERNELSKSSNSPNRRNRDSLSMKHTKQMREGYWNFLGHLNSLQNNQYYMDKPTKYLPRGSLKEKNRDTEEEDK